MYGQILEERSSETQRPLIIHVPAKVSKHVETQKFMEIQKPVKVQKSAEVQEATANITEVGGMIQSSRLFTAPPPTKKENLEANAKNKGK